MALQTLGPFEFIRVVGRGGMGTVYEARETGVENATSVAVKALAPAYSFDEVFRSRFEAEIDALMKLDHRNIVRLLSYGQDEGILFFAMELVDGTSLFQEQKKGQVFHWREIIDIAIQICDGLRHAHERGIIHRDLKPGNLMITTDRKIKITDFGIAKKFGSSSLTSEGNVLGTMDFMAPEQARGQNTNARSDLFSLGAVLYSLLSGRPPFLRDTVDQTFEALLSADPPTRLDKVAPDTPEPLADLVHRLMEKDPSRRISTAMATGRQLAHVRDQILTAKKRATEVMSQSPDSDIIVDGESLKTKVIPNIGPQITADNSSPMSATAQVTAISNAKGNSKSSVSRQDTDDMSRRQPDYFNEVTPQQRNRDFQPIDYEDTTGSFWPLLIGFIAVVILAGAGYWYSVVRPPDRDDLFATISNETSNPKRVSQEIQQFIKHFPNDDEIGFVVGLNDQISVSRYANNLSARMKVSAEPLTATELRFLDIYKLARQDKPAAFDKLESFLSFYSGADDLTTDDSYAVEMARRIRDQWSEMARNEIEQSRRRIHEVLRAGRVSNSKDDSIAKFESIIDIYGEDTWAVDLVEQAREELKKIKGQSQERKRD